MCIPQRGEADFVGSEGSLKSLALLSSCAKHNIKDLLNCSEKMFLIHLETGGTNISEKHWCKDDSGSD